MANLISDETIEYVGILAKLELSDEEKEAVKRQIQIFKEQYDLISCGDYYRLTDVQKSSCAVWETVAKDGSEALIRFFMRRCMSQWKKGILRMRDLM